MLNSHYSIEAKKVRVASSRKRKRLPKGASNDTVVKIQNRIRAQRFRDSRKQRLDYCVLLMFNLYFLSLFWKRNYTL